jgi:hypothetical protein
LLGLEMFLGVLLGGGLGGLEGGFELSELAEGFDFVVVGVVGGREILFAVFEGLVEGLEGFFVAMELVEGVAAIALPSTA